MARSIKEVHTINYYPINEGAARRAKEMNSFSDYKEGSATAEYRAMVDKAAAIAEQQKSRVDPMYHEKIDHLLDTYARKLAENMNQGFAMLSCDNNVPVTHQIFQDCIFPDCKIDSHTIPDNPVIICINL